MEILTGAYLSRAAISPCITTLAYFAMNGAGIFETAVIVPKWSANPPESMQVFRGKHTLDFKTFWIVMHSIHEVTFIVAIFLCWNLETIRNWLMALFALHFLVRVWTIAYFARATMQFKDAANGKTSIPDLHAKAIRWKNLNYLRTGLFVLISIAQIPLLLPVLTMSLHFPK